MVSQLEESLNILLWLLLLYGLLNLSEHCLDNTSCLVSDLNDVPRNEK